MVQAVGSRNLTFFWLAPAATKPVEMISSYTLACHSLREEEDIVLLQFPTAQTGLTIHVFHPFTKYFCSVYAKNHIGRGPAVNASATTLQGGEVTKHLLQHTCKVFMRS